MYHLRCIRSNTQPRRNKAGDFGCEEQEAQQGFRGNSSGAIHTLGGSLQIRGSARNLFSANSFQCGPGDIRYDGTASIHRPQVCRLHQRVHADDLEDAFVIGTRRPISTLRCNHFCFGHMVHSVGRSLFHGIRVVKLPNRKASPPRNRRTILQRRSRNSAQRGPSHGSRGN
jgi:hypothetical protein